VPKNFQESESEQEPEESEEEELEEIKPGGKTIQEELPAEPAPPPIKVKYDGNFFIG